VFHRTQRLLLRPVWPEDWENILGGIADEGVVRNLARAPWPYTAQDAQAFASLPIDDPRCPRFLITRARDGALLGCIGLDEKDGSVELGYWVARPYWRQGIATEAGHAVIDLAKMIGHTNLTAGHFVDNPASGKVLRKLGFQSTGVIAHRHSCGRGKKSPASEYTLDLSAAELKRAA